MRLSLLIGVLTLLLAGLMVISLLVGAKSIPFGDSWQALFGGADCLSQNCTLIRYSRLPRTLAGLVAGVALGLSGSLLQTLTRNPLADSGILGINAGASFAIVLGLLLTGAASPLLWLGFAFSGALIALLIISVTGAAAGSQSSPLRLTLAGVALAAVLEGLTNGLSLMNPDIYDHLRFWLSGSLDIRGFSALQILTPAVVAGSLITLSMGTALNNLSMGDELATSLGTRVTRTRILGLGAVALLSGAATALTGPITFIGLMAPHFARFLIGADHRRMLPVTLLVTPCLLLTADIFGRFLVAGELRVSVVAGLIGAPVLILLARRLSRETV